MANRSDNENQSQWGAHDYVWSTVKGETSSKGIAKGQKGFSSFVFVHYITYWNPSLYLRE